LVGVPAAAASTGLLSQYGKAVIDSADRSQLDDSELAAVLATRAGQLLLDVRERYADAEQGQRRAAGDRESHEYLLAELHSARPTDVVLSEEGRDDQARLAADRVWIVDPLDGTREFAEFRDDWAVHVALWESGDLTAGAVALPASDVTFATPTMSLPPAPDGRPRMVISRTRPPAWTEEVAGTLGADVLLMGSAGAKAMAVVQGHAEIYLHAGGQYEWDSAAPVVVARAAGLHTSRIDGSPLRYNRRDLLLPDLLVCRPELAQRVLAAVRAAVR
jgi:3'(2'), 5'-bisphosphate nucleotidase